MCGKEEQAIPFDHRRYCISIQYALSTHSQIILFEKKKCVVVYTTIFAYTQHLHRLIALLCWL